MPFLMQEYNSERGRHCLCCEEIFILTYLSLSCGEERGFISVFCSYLKFSILKHEVILYFYKRVITLNTTDPFKFFNFLSLEFDTLKHSISCFHIKSWICKCFLALELTEILSLRSLETQWACLSHLAPHSSSSSVPTNFWPVCTKKQCFPFSLFFLCSVLHPALWRLGNECGRNAVCIGEIKCDHVGYILYWVSHFTLFCLSHWIIPLDGNNIPSMYLFYYSGTTRKVSNLHAGSSFLWVSWDLLRLE